MNTENQVCSLETALQLRKLGISQNSRFYHVLNMNKWRLEYIGFLRPKGNLVYFEDAHTSFLVDDSASAFSVAELGIMLPPDNGYYSIISQPSGDWTMCDEFESLELGEGYKKEADARAYLLIDEIKKGLSVDVCNKRLHE